MIESTISHILVRGQHASKDPAAAEMYMKKTNGTKQTHQQHDNKCVSPFNLNMNRTQYKLQNTWIVITEINVGIYVDWYLLQTKSFSQMYMATDTDSKVRARPKQ